MAVSGIGDRLHLTQPGFRQKLIRTLVPLNNGPNEIRALDGLRATAALSVLALHFLSFVNFQLTPLGSATAAFWQYLGTGVELFFVLSGFLLFLPYARAMLHSKPLPSVRGFYRRRALRILPAYWVCFVLLAVILTPLNLTHLDIGDVLSHIVLIHNTFPLYNRDIDGPFWTLAVEVQYYVILPFLAFAISRVVGKSGSPIRLIGCLLAIAACAILLRKVDGVLMGIPTSYNLTGTPVQNFALVFVLLTYGMQGKFLEIFAMGMIASVIYVVVVEDRRLTRGRVVLLGYISLLVAIGTTLLVTVPFRNLVEVTFIPGWSRGWGDAVYPLALGIAYSALLLAVVCGSKAVRFVFETPPMRFVGLISFSFYLWHLPVVSGQFFPFSQLPPAVDLVLAFVVAYLSYQLVERPFLKLRLAVPQRKEDRQPVVVSPLPVDQEVVSTSSQR